MPVAARGLLGWGDLQREWNHLVEAERLLDEGLELLEQSGLDPDACAYMGDDVVDLPVMRRCGLAVCVPAAPALVKQHSHYITQLPGGGGADPAGE